MVITAIKMVVRRILIFQLNKKAKFV